MQLLALSFNTVIVCPSKFEIEDSIRCAIVSESLLMQLDSLTDSVISEPNSSTYHELVVGFDIRISFGVVGADDEDNDNDRFALKFILFIALSHRRKYERILDTLLFVDSVPLVSVLLNFALFSTSSIE